MTKLSINCSGLSTMCRLCLSRGVTLLDIFHFSSIMQNEVADVIMTCAPVQITKHDELPNVICQLCYNQVEKIQRFQMQVVESDKTLRRYLLQLNTCDRQINRESSFKRLSENPLIDISKTNIPVKCESSELQGMFDSEEKSPMNFNSVSKINNEISKSEIQEGTTDNNSQLLTDCVDETLETLSECDDSERKDSKIDIDDTKIGFEVGTNCKETGISNAVNEGISLKLEIKQEPTNDNSPILRDDGEISWEDSKMDISDTKVGFETGINWKETANSTLISTNALNEGMSLKLNIKQEPTNYNSSILTDDEEISWEDSNIDISDTKVGFETWKETSNSTLISRNAFNEGVSIKSEIKHEPTNDNFSILTKCVNDAVNASSKDDGTEMICDKSSILSEHKRIHPGGKPHQCDVCNKHYSHLSALYRHKRTIKHLNLHKQLHTGEKPYKCEVCSKRFTLLDTLNKHQCTHKVEKPFQCNVCNKNFSQAVHLNSHKRQHTGEKPYTCDVCNKPFSSSSALNRHKLTHANDKQYRCDVCDKHFSQIGHFNRHKQLHTGEKPYQCEVCSKRFTLLDTLNRHKWIHKVKTPFKCDVCNKHFSQAAHLNSHKRQHTGEKPYTCNVCNKGFTALCSLKNHKRIHIGEKPYQCDFCNKLFTELGSLKKHERIHTGEKPYQCDACKKCFTRSDSLNVHKLTHII